MFLLGFAPFFLFGRPSFPHRGLLVETLYRNLTILNAMFLWLVIFWVGYETRACARFIEILSDVPSVWPKPLLDREEAKTGVPRAHLDDYLDFQLIVLATRRIHWLIYLPFVLLLFLVLARSNLFDAMDFPLPLVFVTGLALAYALYTAVLLRRSAEAARAKVLEHYDARLLAQARLKDSPAMATAGCSGKPDPHAYQRGADQAADGAYPQHPRGRICALHPAARAAGAAFAVRRLRRRATDRVFDQFMR